MADHITQAPTEHNGMMPYWCVDCHLDCANRTPLGDAGTLLCWCCALEASETELARRVSEAAAHARRTVAFSRKCTCAACKTHREEDG